MAPAPESRALVSAIGQVALTVSNLPRALEFYRDVLGLTFLFDAANMVFFDCGGVRLMLSVAEQPKSGYNSILYYRTDNIHRTAEQLTTRGVAFESAPRRIAKMPDHELWMAFFRDSEGNLLALMSEVE